MAGVSISMRTPSREQLHSHLVASRIAGVVATPRENNLDHYLRMSNREPLYLLGLRPQGAWTPAAVLDLMVERLRRVTRPEPYAR